LVFICVSAVTAAPDPFPLDAEGEAWVRGTLVGMTLEQKVGQLIMPRIGYRSTTDPESFAQDLAKVRDLEVGAFIVGGPSGKALVPLLNRLQEASAVPLLVCADFETGVGRVWDDATRFPRQMALAATGDPQTAYFMGEVTAREGRACGVHWPLVPICDVNINPQNPIINIRSFGEDVGTVSAFAAAFTRGVQENGGLACMKHYPGHGDTATDSHMELAYVEAERDRLEAVEFPPFKANVDAGVGSVMSSHVWFPAIMQEEGRIPGTISHHVMTDLLRGEMGFKGLAVTDSMRMRGITDVLEAGPAAVASVQAGIDGILVSEDDEEAHAALVEAVRTGEISENRLNESVERILRAKAWLGLHHGAVVNEAEALASLRRPEDVEGAMDVGRRSITVIRDQNEMLPLEPTEIHRVLLVSLFDEYRAWGRESFDPIVAGLEERFGHVESELLLSQPTRQRLERFIDSGRRLSRRDIEQHHTLTPARRRNIVARAVEADAVIVTAHVRVAAYKGAISIDEHQMALIQELCDAGAPLIVVTMGSPYLPTSLPDVPCHVLTYDSTEVMAELLAPALAGEHALTGRLPVTLPGIAERGDGLQISARE
jgi:beta-glucosidase-like glycosyl hydrolase